MRPDQLIVTAIGGGLIGFIWWFFFGEKNSEKNTIQAKKDIKGNLVVDIVVDGGYKPAVIFLEKGKKTTLKVVRKDANTCLSDIILPDFRISKYLPFNKVVNIDFIPGKSGEFPFHCGMNMFHGKIVVD